MAQHNQKGLQNDKVTNLNQSSTHSNEKKTSSNQVENEKKGNRSNVVNNGGNKNRRKFGYQGF